MTRRLDDLRIIGSTVTKADADDKIVAALRARAAMLGYDVPDAALRRIAGGVWAPGQEDEPFSPQDWDDELIAAGTQLPAHPKPATATAPAALPSHRGEGNPRVGKEAPLRTIEKLQQRAEALGRRLGDGEADALAQNVEGGFVKDQPDIDAQLLQLSAPVAPDPPADPRAAMKERQAIAIADGLSQQGWDRSAALQSAFEQVEAGTVSDQIGRTAAALTEKHGLSPTEARKLAAEGVIADRRAALVNRSSSRPAVTERVEKAAGVIVKARKKRGLSQSQLAAEVGATDRSVQLWESGQAVPSGLLLWRLADTLGLAVEQVRQIGMSRGQ